MVDVNSNFSVEFFLTIFFHFRNNSSVLAGICLFVQFSIFAISSSDASFSWIIFSAASPAVNSILTTPSWSFDDLNIFICPTSPVMSRCVPPHASTSNPTISTILRSFPGTAPPWYILKPYFASATFLFMNDLYIGRFSLTILFAASSICVSCSFERFS